MNGEIRVERSAVSIPADDVVHPYGTQQLGLFGASTRGGAALLAAAQRPCSVVSRGGRPDLAGHEIPRVRAPTLLIVGGNDPTVLQMKRRAIALMKCKSELKVVPGATHLFEEAGTLAEVADLAAAWFIVYLAQSPEVRG